MDGAGRFFFMLWLFFGVNKHAAKTRQCTGTKLGIQIGCSNLTCNVILILLRCHLAPLARALNPTGEGKFGDFQPIHRRISETVEDRAIVTIIH